MSTEMMQTGRGQPSAASRLSTPSAELSEEVGREPCVIAEALDPE